MKIALMHGACVNAGDFLIKERAKALLKHYYPECEINEFYRNQKLDGFMEQINSNDIMIFAGGPGYFKDFYPRMAPLTDNLDNFKIPLMFMGMGWYGADSNPYTVYKYELGEAMTGLLKRAVNDTGLLGCRDYFSMNILRNAGIEESLMTGCPAWYDLGFVNQTEYTGPRLNEVKKICISNPADQNNYPMAMELAVFIRKFFGDKDITFVCHRGFANPALGVDKVLESYGIKYVDISNSDDGFKIYDDCDLHIGYRVHAHIYNLSKRKLSILVEEDGRGAGVDMALGLSGIPARISALSGNKIAHIENTYIPTQAEDELLNLEANNYAKLDAAFYMMNKYYKEMERHVKSIKDFI